MANFLMTYFGGKPPASPEEGKAHRVQYQQWLAGLGDVAVSPMNPLKHIQTIQADGSASSGSASQLSGYTIVAAESMEEAVAIAKACPFLAAGGTLEVGELVDMGS